MTSLIVQPNDSKSITTVAARIKECPTDIPTHLDFIILVHNHLTDPDNQGAARLGLWRQRQKAVSMVFNEPDFNLTLRAMSHLTDQLFHAPDPVLDWFSLSPRSSVDHRIDAIKVAQIAWNKLHTDDWEPIHWQDLLSRSVYIVDLWFSKLYTSSKA